MNRDDIIRMAREARWMGNVDGWTFNGYEELEHFAALVAAAEREACARIADTYAGPKKPMMVSDMEAGAYTTAEAIAADIRARGEA